MKPLPLIRLGGVAVVGAAGAGLASGYVRRAIDNLPKRGSRPPWKLRRNSVLDLLDMKFSRPDDGFPELHRRAPERMAA